MSSPINLLLAGSGIFAQTSYLPALLANTPSIKLAALWSRSPSSTDALVAEAKNLGLPTDALAVHNGADGLDAALADSSIDAVAFVLPITAQPALIEKAWRAGKHVISEKPLGKDVESARALVQLYETEFQPKGLIWRVAENFNHDSAMRLARKLVRDEALGPVLYYQLIVHAFCADGSKYQATQWRTVPDYQGGFLLDGGVHFAAAVRTILPVSPARIIASSSLHRTHLLPHDTIIGLALPPSSAETDAHGPATQLKGVRDTSEVPGGLGRSAPTGSVTVSWAAPDLAAEDKERTGLFITCLNGLVQVYGTSAGWTVEVRPSQAEGVSVQRTKENFKGDGVEVELREFAEAVQERKAGKEPSKEDWGAPRLALWDLAFIEAHLKSQGKEIDLAKLIEGQ